MGKGQKTSTLIPLVDFTLSPLNRGFLLSSAHVSWELGHVTDTRFDFTQYLSIVRESLQKQCRAQPYPEVQQSQGGQSAQSCQSWQRSSGQTFAGAMTFVTPSIGSIGQLYGKSSTCIYHIMYRNMSCTWHEGKMTGWKHVGQCPRTPRVHNIV